MKKLLLFAMFYMVHKTTFAQSGWLRRANSFNVTVGYAYSLGNTYFATDGVLNPNANNFIQRSLNFLGEYGISNNINVILNFPVYKFQNFENYSVASGVGNPQLELKFAVQKKFPVISFSLGMELPLANQTNYSVSRNINSSGLFDRVNLPTGYPDFNYWGTLSVSSALGNLPGWISLNSKFVARTKGFNNQFNYGVEVGYKFTKIFCIIARLTTQNQIGTNSVKSSIVNGEETEFTAFGLDAAYKITSKIHVHFDYDFYNDLLLNRKNVYSSPFYRISMSFEY